MEELPYNSDKKMLLYKKSSVENALVISKRRNVETSYRGKNSVKY